MVKVEEAVAGARVGVRAEGAMGGARVVERAAGELEAVAPAAAEREAVRSTRPDARYQPRSPPMFRERRRPALGL